MTTKTLLARLFRALSGLSLRRFAEKADLDPALVAQYDKGATQPGDENLARMGQAAGLTVRDGERVLRVAEALRQERQRASPSLDALLGDLVSQVYERVLRLPLPASPSTAADRRLAEEQWSRLRDLSPDQQRTVVRIVAEVQTRAFAERVREEAIRDPERAAWLAELGGLIAEQVRDAPRDERLPRGTVASPSQNAPRPS
jgi:transcriptional regulator with XRE-family HTH domain